MFLGHNNEAQKKWWELKSQTKIPLWQLLQGVGHVRYLRYGATFVVGYTSPAVVLNASMTTKNPQTFSSQNVL